MFDIIGEYINLGGGGDKCPRQAFFRMLHDNTKVRHALRIALL